MADNVAITAGTGTLIATDDVGGVHYPKNKLDVGGDGVSLPLSHANPVPTHEARATVATLANVAGSASSVTLQASNTARRALIIVNDSAATLYVKYGSTASTTSYTHQLQAGESTREDVYTGIVTGIWASAVGAARMTELTV